MHATPESDNSVSMAVKRKAESPAFEMPEGMGHKIITRKRSNESQSNHVKWKKEELYLVLLRKGIDVRVLTCPL
jgi:hypothetical protein